MRYNGRKVQIKFAGRLIEYPVIRDVTFYPCAMYFSTGQNTNIYVFCAQFPYQM